MIYQKKSAGNAIITVSTESDMSNHTTLGTTVLYVGPDTTNFKTNTFYKYTNEVVTNYYTIAQVGVPTNVWLVSDFAENIPLVDTTQHAVHPFVIANVDVIDMGEDYQYHCTVNTSDGQVAGYFISELIKRDSVPSVAWQNITTGAERWVKTVINK